MTPLVGVGEHGVDVAQVAEGRTGGTRAAAAGHGIPTGHRTLAAGRRALQPRNEVRPPRLGAEQLTLKARLAEHPRQVFLRRALIPRWVDRVEAQQALEQLGGLPRQIAHRPIVRH